jgi:hypothetical protein
MKIEKFTGDRCEPKLVAHHPAGDADYGSGQISRLIASHLQKRPA